MKKVLLCLAIACTGFAFGQIFEEDWDGNGPGISAWTIIDVDGSVPDMNVGFITDAWVVVDKDGDEGSFGGPAGDHAAASTSWYSPPGTSNDWLITPVIELPDEDLTVFFDIKAQDASYPDGYELKLAPNAGNTVDDFTVTLLSIEAENPAWITRTASLAEYAGTSIRLAWVNNSTDMFMLLLDNINIGTLDVTLPSCVTLDAPVDGATDVDPANATFSWTPAEGDTIDGYTFMLGDSAETLANIGTITETSTPVTGLDYGTTYYWSIIPNNLAGSASDCAVYSFTTAPSDFDPYCGPVSISFIEAITHVNFAGIDSAVNGAEPHLNFIDVSGQVNPGDSYTMTLQGDTAGAYDNYFTVFIDWNQNGVLDDEGEIYTHTEPLTNSNGADGQTVTIEIMVPEDAITGDTRMRVFKNYNSAVSDPCTGTTFGQVADFTIVVGTMSTSEISLNRVSVYPNPAKSVLNLRGFVAENITVYNMLGQAVKVHFDGQQINVEKLPIGNYILQAENASGEVKTVKFIKK